MQRKRCVAQLRPGFSLSLRVLQIFDRERISWEPTRPASRREGDSEDLYDVGVPTPPKKKTKVEEKADELENAFLEAEDPLVVAVETHMKTAGCSRAEAEAALDAAARDEEEMGKLLADAPDLTREEAEEVLKLMFVRKEALKKQSVSAFANLGKKKPKGKLKLGSKWKMAQKTLSDAGRSQAQGSSESAQKRCGDLIAKNRAAAGAKTSDVAKLGAAAKKKKQAAEERKKLKADKVADLLGGSRRVSLNQFVSEQAEYNKKVAAMKAKQKQAAKKFSSKGGMVLLVKGGARSFEGKKRLCLAILSRIDNSVVWGAFNKWKAVAEVDEYSKEKQAKRKQKKAFRTKKVSDAVRNSLIKFYEEVSPSNVANVDAILEHYAGMGQLEDLFEGLEAKYPGRKLERPDVKREEDAKPQSKSSGDGSGATKNGDGQTFSI